jgi:hypothetical protein
MTSSQDQSRRSRLNHLFRDVLSGKRLIRTAQDAQLFLEAVRAQEPPSKCAEMLVSSNHGLEAIRNAIRLDVSRQFILSHTLPWLRYLSDPGIKALVNGQLLGRLIEIVTHPSTVIDALIALFEADQIPDEALYPFAWLSLEIMNMPPGGLADPSRLIACLSASTRLIKCEIHETRELGYRIQKTINMLSKPVQSVPGGPGGRHDNDHEDIRDIAIYPTTDEFLSSHSPYYRTLQEITETPADQRVRAHIDNQFRLLREDMLAELREDIQIATGKKKGRRKVLVLGQLAFKGIDMKDGADRYKKSTLLLRCGSGLECLDKYSVNERRKFLRDHPSILRHQTFGVFCNDNKDIVAFAFVERNIDDLVMNPPIVSLQMIDHEHLGRALLALATNKQGLQFLPVDTPVFAYEPVLCELQRMTAVPLLDLLINPAAMSSVNFEVPTRLLDVVTRLREGLERFKEGASSIRIKRPDKKAIDLDESQLRALLGALSNPVTLIQGPPGMLLPQDSPRAITSDAILQALENRSLAPKSYVACTKPASRLPCSRTQIMLSTSSSRTFETQAFQSLLWSASDLEANAAISLLRFCFRNKRANTKDPRHHGPSSRRSRTTLDNKRSTSNKRSRSLQLLNLVGRRFLSTSSLPMGAISSSMPFRFPRISLGGKRLERRTRLLGLIGSSAAGRMARTLDFSRKLSLLSRRRFGRCQKNRGASISTDGCAPSVRNAWRLLKIWPANT